MYKIGGRIKDKELQKAVLFLSPMMKITPEGVVSASYLSGVVLFLCLTLLLYVLNISLLITILLALLASVMAYYIVATYPISVMNGYKLNLSEEADLVFEQFILVFQSGGTIFDAIEMVANSRHPLLSATFSKFLNDINRGIPPEECISEFAKNQPSDDLRRYLIAILSSLETKTDLLEMISGESFEADTTLRQKNLEIESRLLIVAALVTYIPIMFTLAVSLGGYATNLAVLIIAPFFIILNAILRSRFSRSFSAYFDRPQATGISVPTQKQIIEEYDEFLNFMILLGERLRLGDVLEVALPAVREDVGPEVQRIIDPAINSVYWNNRSLDEAMTLAAENALGQRVANLIGMITRMCEASALNAGERISRISARLVKRSAVAKERDTIIAAQKLKVLLLSITSSIVLGLLTSLAPFLFIGQLLTGDSSLFFGSIGILDIMPLVTALGATTASTGYQNTRMVGGSRSVLIGFICLLLYLISFVFASGIMGMELV